MALVLLGSGPASAHIPVLEPERSSDAPPGTGPSEGAFPGAIDLPDPSISRAVYGFLAPDEAFDVYRFRVAEKIEIPISILVPKRDELASFRPSFALVGSGLPDETEDLPETVADRLRQAADAGPTGPTVGAVIGSAPAEDWGSFFEPFSFERYHEGPEIRAALEPDRDYYVVVYHPAGREGDYVLGLGTREAFGLTDMARSIVAVARIKLGLYGQSGVRWGPLVVAAAIAAAVVFAAVLLVIAVRRRRGARGAT